MLFVRPTRRHDGPYSVEKPIKIHDWRKQPIIRSYGQCMGIISLSAHTRPIYPTNFAGSPYTARVTALITSIECSIIIVGIYSSMAIFVFKNTAH